MHYQEPTKRQDGGPGAAFSSHPPRPTHTATSSSGSSSKSIVSIVVSESDSKKRNITNAITGCDHSHLPHHNPCCDLHTRPTLSNTEPYAKIYTWHVSQAKMVRLDTPQQIWSSGRWRKRTESIIICEHFLQPCWSRDRRSGSCRHSS